MTKQITAAIFDQEVMMTQAYAAHGKQIGWAKGGYEDDEIKAAILMEYVKGESVLDVGCAVGTYTNLAQKLAWTVGIDVNEHLLDAARLEQPHLPFVQGSVLQLPFTNKSFDTTIAFDILEHVPEKQALEELVRVTSQRLILCVPHTTPNVLSELFLLYGHHADTTHLRTYNEQSMRHVLQQNELTPVLLQPSHPLSTDALFINILEGQTYLKKILRKICFMLAKPKQFYSNLIVVADITT